VTRVIIPKRIWDDIKVPAGSMTPRVRVQHNILFTGNPNTALTGGLTIVPAPWRNRFTLIVCTVLLVILTGAPVLAAMDDAVEPVVYLNFNEGSGIVALDASGNGNAGTLHNVSRVENGGCGGALVFDRIDNYVSIPYRSANHPEKGITVSTWFYVDSFEPQALITTGYNGGYYNGGYGLAFGDGNDLWWTINLPGEDEVSVNVQHEGITPRQWHQVAGMYDGKTSKIYLDGVLRNQVNASGPIVYETPNYVMLGAAAGRYDTPDTTCPQYFHGGLDEVRIYDQAIPYNQIMDDRFRCSQETVSPPQDTPAADATAASCTADSGSMNLAPGESVSRILTFTDNSMTGTWQVRMQPGSTLVVKADDRYSEVNPDSWYIEIADKGGAIDRSIAFPNTRNTPIDGVITDGNATVSIRYFDGKERFPATVAVQFAAIAPPPPPPPPVEPFLNPIIVIYSASWATLIALILVILWLHRRSKERRQNGASPEGTPAEEKKND
jgi:hypothetical protein